MEDTFAAGTHPLICPLCEVYELRTYGRNAARCDTCEAVFSGALLETLYRIKALPEAVGRHACEECGHPEMRVLPDGVYWCPACGSEVLPISPP